MKKIIYLIIIVLSALCGSISAQVTLPSILGDNMVLQQQSELDIWGWSDPTCKMTLKTSWDTTVYRTTSANDTKWRFKIKTPKAGGPYTITIKGIDELTIKNVMIGEVWLCSGQSNMEWSSVNGFANSKAEVENANYSDIRLFHVKKMTAKTPQENCTGSWKECSPASVRAFSAIAYFFARSLHDSLKVPIGVINASWGGSAAEMWVPKDRIINDSVLLANSKQQSEFSWVPFGNGDTYNSMIHPIVPFRLAGAIWYQGESNVHTASGYTRLMSTLIDSWRKDFNAPLPFGFVQIAPFDYSWFKPTQAARLREAQARLLNVPNTGMVVITDLVDNIKNIHPNNKQDVGKRLAAWALAESYGRTDIAYQSPMFKSLKIEKDKLRLSFDHCANGLVCKDKEITHFEIAGTDHKFYPALAKIDAKTNTVLLSSPEVKSPVAARFGFSNIAMPNLFSRDGLPVCPFRTDDWNE